MKQQNKTVCLVVSGICKENIRLQPWRYLSEVAIQLFQEGYKVSIITDTSGMNNLNRDIPVYSISSVRQFGWQRNYELVSVLESLNPQFVLWNVGVTSFLHQRLPLNKSYTHIGIFTSPIYTIEELSKLGWSRLLKNWSVCLFHILGTYFPDFLLRSGTKRNPFNVMVFETQTTAQRAYNRFWDGASRVILPGVDDVWQKRTTRYTLLSRRKLGFSEKELVVGYFGSLHPIRGVHTLIYSISQSLHIHPQIRLLILSRPSSACAIAEYEITQQLITKAGIANKSRLIQDMFSPAELAERIAACDLIALPFELMPSDAPLSVLEVQALGKPVITTRLACLPEMLYLNGYLAEPGNVNSLVDMINKAVHQLTQNSSTILLDKRNAGLRTWQVVGHEWSNLLQSL